MKLFILKFYRNKKKLSGRVAIPDLSEESFELKQKETSG